MVALLSSRVVAVGASAGGLRALRELLSALPGDLPASILVIQHLDPHHYSIIAQILAKHTALAVKQAEDGEIPERGTVYIAPPDAHLLINAGGAISLEKSERVHYVRPSVDVLFKSVAERYGASVIAVILTGAGSDGGDGIRAVKAAGGVTIVQDPETADYSGMPSTAVATGAVDHVLPLEAVAGKLIELVAEGERP